MLSMTLLLSTSGRSRSNERLLLVWLVAVAATPDGLISCVRKCIEKVCCDRACYVRMYYDQQSVL